MWLYAMSVLASFVSVFIKIFQFKNVAGDHFRLAFFTSYAMAVLDVVTVNMIITGGWIIALTSGTGAAIGVVTAMKIHDRYVPPRKPNGQEPQGPPTGT
jgi:hypothetical protein